MALSLNWQLLGLVPATVGLEGFSIGCVAQVLFDYDGSARRRWLRVFPYTRTVGIVALIPMLVRYFHNGLALRADSLDVERLAVTGIIRRARPRSSEAAVIRRGGGRPAWRLPGGARRQLS